MGWKRKVSGVCKKGVSNNSTLCHSTVNSNEDDANIQREITNMFILKKYIDSKIS